MARTTHYVEFGQPSRTYARAICGQGVDRRTEEDNLNPTCTDCARIRHEQETEVAEFLAEREQQQG